MKMGSSSVWNHALAFTALMGVLLSVSACGFKSGSGSQEKLSAPEEYRLSDLDVNMYPVHKTVCDPFEEGGSDPRSNFGLKAELYYLSPAQQHYESVADVIANGHKSDQNLFFASLNVPTRRFEKGFINDLGDSVKDDSGAVLNEYFALRFKSVLKLAADQDPGLYEIAILSDDGTVLRLRDDDGVYRTYVDNDGLTATRMGCSSQPVQLNRDTEKMMQLDYHQGPRYHIALVMMMRKVEPNMSKDPSCGYASNEDWFDYHQTPTKPKAKYNDLLARGWRPLTKDNFSLPLTTLFNPCKEGVAPVITNFRIIEASSGGFSVSWQTDIPATSQLAALDKATGQTTVTTSDNVLRTSHSVVISGLKLGAEYSLTAISISDSYGKTLSTPISAFTEP